MLLPSVLFWSSGIMKEALAIPAMLLVITTFLEIYLGDKIQWLKISMAFFGFLIQAVLKGANLANANFSGAHLQSANLFEANLDGTALEDAHLAGAMKPNGDIYE